MAVAVCRQRLQAQDGDANAVAQLLAQSQQSAGDIEQHKAAWLAGAYAAEAQCHGDPEAARVQLETLLAQMQQALPEGGAVPREVRRIRDGCKSSPPPSTPAHASRAR